MMKITIVIALCLWCWYLSVPTTSTLHLSNEAGGRQRNVNLVGWKKTECHDDDSPSNQALWIRGGGWDEMNIPFSAITLHKYFRSLKDAAFVLTAMIALDSIFWNGLQAQQQAENLTKLTTDTKKQEFQLGANLSVLTNFCAVNSLIGLLYALGALYDAPGPSSKLSSLSLFRNTHELHMLGTHWHTMLAMFAHWGVTLLILPEIIASLAYQFCKSGNPLPLIVFVGLRVWLVILTTTRIKAGGRLQKFFLEEGMMWVGMQYAHTLSNAVLSSDPKLILLTVVMAVVIGLYQGLVGCCYMSNPAKQRCQPNNKCSQDLILT